MDRSHLKEVEGLSNGSYSDPARIRPAAPNRNEGIGAESSVDLDRIREILYGNERRDTERRMAELEERIEAHTVQSELEIQRRMEAFEEQMKGELRSLASEISAAQRQGADTVEAIARDLKSSLDQVEEQVHALANRADAAEQDLRNQLGQQVATLSESIRQNYEELNRLLEAKVRELRAESVDWAGLSSTLRDLSNQVGTRRPGRDVSAAHKD